MDYVSCPSGLEFRHNRAKSFCSGCAAFGLLHLDSARKGPLDLFSFSRSCGNRAPTKVKLFTFFFPKKKPSKCWVFFRKERDSNPRYPCEYSSLAGTCLRPLSHLSIDKDLNSSGGFRSTGRTEPGGVRGRSLH